MQRLTYLLALWMLLCCLFEASMAQDAGGDNSDSSGGDSSDDEDNTNYWVYVHGILMSLGWVALLPLGALIAQNRWLQGFKTKIASREVWFVTHITIQAVGAALIIAAIGIAYSESTGMEPEKDETVAYTHKIIGTIAFAFLLLQIAGGLVRPTPGTRFRGVWNHFHHNSGRLAILLAWVNIWLGVAIWQDGGDGMVNGLLAWVVPLAVFQGLLLIAYLVGAFTKPKVVAATETQKPQTDGRAQVHAAAPAGALQSTQV